MIIPPFLSKINYTKVGIISLVLVLLSILGFVFVPKFLRSQLRNVSLEGEWDRRRRWWGWTKSDFLPPPSRKPKIDFHFNSFSGFDPCRISCWKATAMFVKCGQKLHLQWRSKFIFSTSLIPTLSFAEEKFVHFILFFISFSRLVPPFCCSSQSLLEKKAKKLDYEKVEIRFLMR